MRTKLAVMILACERHTAAVTQMLDKTGVGDWTVVPAVQSRCMGYLQHVLPRHGESGYAIFGFGERADMMQALQTLTQAERAGEVCPNCVAHMWEVHQMLLSHVALDFVCDEVVDQQSALSTAYQGETYYFCSEACRAAFLNHPQIYVQQHAERRIGRRELASAHPESTHAGKDA